MAALGYAKWSNFGASVRGRQLTRLYTLVLIFSLCYLVHLFSDATILTNLLGRQSDALPFAYDARRNPQVCLQTQKEILRLSSRKRPHHDFDFSTSGVRANISGWVAANSLVDGCWTYKERYMNYERLPRTYYHHNKCNQLYPRTRHSKTAFNIRLSSNQTWTGDVITSIRAAVVELSWHRGHDVFLLIHIKNHKTFDQRTIPAEFRPFTIPFTMDDLIKDYDPEIIRPIKNPPRQLPVMAQFNHLAETFFMRMNPQYEFAWFVEIDVRSMAPWHIFLDHVESTMHGTVPHDTHRDDNGRGDKGGRGAAAVVGVVDLISFTPSYRVDLSWPWGPSLRQFPNASLTMSLLQTHRISRALSEAMHRHHFLGRNAYFEGFMTTVATMDGLRKFIYANPVLSDSQPPFTGMPFTGIAEVDVAGDRLHKKNLDIGNLEPHKQTLWHGATYSPQARFSVRYYNQWMQDDEICRPASLVHPVKNSVF